jgi:Zn-dependent metalloprotease
VGHASKQFRCTELLQSSLITSCIAFEKVMAKPKKQFPRQKTCSPQRCPICCILPPHLLDKMLQQDDEQRYLALKTLSTSEQFRGRRAAVGNVSFAVSPGQKRRTIYDAKTSTSLPGVLVRGEGDPDSDDPAVNEAYDAAGLTYDLFRDIYDRNSIDDRGLRLDATVHYDVRYENAFWNGDQMVYGDGDGRFFNRFTVSIDVIAHELTHGIVSYEAALDYKNESGALNESFADVFGTLVKQRSRQQTVQQADWLIGTEQFTAKVQGVALRSMKAPGTAYNDRALGKDPQPAHYKDLYQGTFDDGGVHINSGIPNRAFYLAAMAIGGFAWEKTGRIWYDTLRSGLKANSGFKDAAIASGAVAGQLYGQGSDEQKAVQSAWQQVGVG